MARLKELVTGQPDFDDIFSTMDVRAVLIALTHTLKGDALQGIKPETGGVASALYASRAGSNVEQPVKRSKQKTMIPYPQVSFGRKRWMCRLFLLLLYAP